MTYEYAAALVRVIDGDTVILRLDLGLRLSFVDSFRLLGLNAPELHSRDEDERKRAAASAAALNEILSAPGMKIRARTAKSDKYGRWLVELEVAPQSGPEWLSVNRWLIEKGHAVPYDGGAR